MRAGKFERGGARAGHFPADGEPLPGTNGKVGGYAAGKPLHAQADADRGRGKGAAKTRTLSQISQEIEGQSEKDLPSGTLRVACAHFTAMHLIAPVLPELLSRYPQLRIELDVNNHPVSLVGERIDVAVRIIDNPEPGMIARRLGECRSVLCASPAYLAQHGTPVSPEELAQHNCLHYSFFAGQSWHFLTPEGESLSVAVSGNLSASISSLLMDAAIKHCGIAMLPEREASAALEQGLLVPVLEALEPKPFAIHGIYQSREYQPAALRVFLDELSRYGIRRNYFAFSQETSCSRK